MKYAKRIYAYAYAKTRDTQNAEDLSQEILLALLRSNTAHIENMDAYVYGICRHVWARYLSRNKPHWEATRHTNALDFLSDEKRVEEAVEQRAEYAVLRREIAYLSCTRREALVMRYFEGKGDAEIAAALRISPATVRWHLHKAKGELKGRLIMENKNGMRAPIKLQVGHSGYIVDPTMGGLVGDLLTQNIAWACYETPLRVEEIARALDVPAAYVESKLDALAGMDYVKRIADKYQTNFFIHTPEYLLARARYNYKHTQPLADAFFGAAQSALPALRNIGFIGSDLPEEELLWHVLPELMMYAYQRLTARLHDALHLHHGKPMRPDGTTHWVFASLDPMPTTDDPDFNDYLRRSVCFGIKGRSWNDHVESMQFDFSILGRWREFNAPELANARRAAQVMRGAPMDDTAREAIAALTRDGYAENGKLMIPYLSKAERRAYEDTLDRAISQLDMDALYAPFEGYAHEMAPRIPRHIDQNERAHLLTSYDPFATSVYFLVKSGKLFVPDAYISRRLSTIVWENVAEIIL